MDITIKVTGIHVVVGIFASLISAALTLGWFGFKNDIFAFFIAVIILYFTGQACQKMFGDEISPIYRNHKPDAPLTLCVIYDFLHALPNQQLVFYAP